MKYKISELAKLLDVSTNTVRRYEEMGYIQSIRDDNSGYRYYSDDAIFGILNARLMRKYEFTHDELDDMLQYNLSDTIAAYEKKMQEMSEKIAYMTYVRHRMKDDLLLMKKADAGCEVYEKTCVEQICVLFKDKGKISKEEGRLKKIQEFLYGCPEIQRVYIVRKSSIDNGTFAIIPGLAIKEMHMEKYNMTENEYTERYLSRKSVMGMVKIPSVNTGGDKAPEELKEAMLGEHLKYIEEHNMQIAGDIIAIVISRAVEDGREMMYILVSVPVE